MSAAASPPLTVPAGSPSPWPGRLRVALLWYLGFVAACVAYGRVDLGFMSFGGNPQNLLGFATLLAMGVWLRAPRTFGNRSVKRMVIVAGLALLTATVLMTLVLVDASYKRSILIGFARHLMLAAVACYPVAVLLAWKGPDFGRGGGHVAGLLGYTALITFASLWAYSAQEALDGMGDAWPAVAFFLLVACSVRTQRDLWPIAGLFLLGSAAIAVRALVLYEPGIDLGNVVRWYQKNTFADFLAVPLGLGLGLLWVNRRSPLRAAGAALLCAPLGLSILLSHSRGALAGTVVGLLVLLLLLGRRASRILLPAALIALLALVNAFPGRVYRIPVVQTFLLAGSRTDANLRERLEYFWPQGLALFASRPLTGFGPGGHKIFGMHELAKLHNVRLRKRGAIAGEFHGAIVQGGEDFVIDIMRGSVVVRPAQIASVGPYRIRLKNGSAFGFAFFNYSKNGARSAFHFYATGGRLRVPGRSVRSVTAVPYPHAHSVPLQVLVSLGVPGGLFWIAFWIAAVCMARANRRRYTTGIAGAVAVATVFWMASHFTHSLVEHFYERSRYNMAIALLWALAFALRYLLPEPTPGNDPLPPDPTQEPEQAGP